ncbi:MAG: ABC transporter ATP-binding protein [Alphaproteobacteria bacterium]|nr:ABC transporter ATP-binding protein [Alphaproteobacteria bacterium]
MTGTLPIRLAGASKTFRRGAQTTEALTPIDIEIAPGEFFAVVGPSGCGKSTLLRMIAGLIPATSGTITVGAGTVTKPVTEVGIVFQSPVLLDWRTVLGNVLAQLELRGLDATSYEPQARRLLDAVGLKGFEDRYPFELSGGMRQRVAIVRALIHNPPVLLMDEPFGALDALTREQLRLDLEALWLAKPKTVVFITHSIDEAVLLADRVAVMSPRPGSIERLLTIDLPRPRGIAARQLPAFTKVVEEVTNLFLERGVLQATGKLSLG